MPFVAHDPVTMKRVEEAPVTAKKRWKLEDGPTPPSGFVVLVAPERGTNAAGVPI
jgi:hypothetical protein